jgi:hypothetical protein
MWIAVTAFILIASSGLVDRCEARKKGAKRMEIKVTSTAFEAGDMIPKKYTCDDINVSPPLAFSGIPAGAKSVALICDDPDAPRGTWVHWVLYNLPASAKQLPEHVPAQATLPNGARHGRNDFGNLGYGGPCPPSGTHRYFFKVYALNAELDLQPGATKAQFVRAMNGHVLAQGELVGKYKR